MVVISMVVISMVVIIMVVIIMVSEGGSGGDMQQRQRVVAAAAVTAVAAAVLTSGSKSVAWRAWWIRWNCLNLVDTGISSGIWTRKPATQLAHCTAPRHDNDDTHKQAQEVWGVGPSSW